jgi:hypothetical protein
MVRELIISGTVSLLTTKKIQDSCQLAGLQQICFGIHVEFFPHGVTINAQYYSNLLHGDLRQAIWKERPGKLSKKIILLRDNAHPHMADFMKVT